MSDMDDDEFFDDMSDHDMDDDDFDVGSIEKEGGTLDSGHHAENNYEVLKPKDLISKQLTYIEDVNTIFQIPAPTARILLQHFNWDKERLVERYYEGDQEKLFEEAHIVDPNKAGAGLTVAADAATGPSECEICMSETDPKSMVGLPCHHLFCSDCWNQYLRGKIMEEGSGQNIHCPQHGCDILVDEWTVSKLILDPKVLSRYEYLVARDFVGSNRYIKFCPAPGCENAIKVQSLQTFEVTCECGHKFCFNCQQSVHDPVKCEMLKKWLIKCADDSETANWIAAHTKECPKCKTTIEKNGGCNHMTCRSPTCKYEFCWVCCGPWEPHGSSWYNCNRFEEGESINAREAQAKSRAYLERYLHYYNRYANHEQSARFERQLYEQVEKKMEELQHLGMTWIEVQFLRRSVDILCECRNTLKYTYVFGYFLARNNQSIIFEDNQRDLEMATEQLSEYMEQNVNKDAAQDIKKKVLDKSKYCESRRKILLDHVAKGHEDDYWDYLNRDDILSISTK
eukprot:Clim_evm154s210 gene=Clim_evmTU154s210